MNQSQTFRFGKAARALCPLLGGAVLLLARPTFAHAPLAYWSANKTAADTVGGHDGSLEGGVTYAPGFRGAAFSFDGTNGVVHIPDSDAFKLTGSFTITAYVYVRSQAQNSRIFFRGDNRDGLDPYGVGINTDGNCFFQIDTEKNETAVVKAVIPRDQWVFLCASLDDTTGVMTLVFNNHVAAQLTTDLRPFRDLDPAQNPGLAIGNTQNPGSCDEAFNGRIEEVALYDIPYVAPTYTTSPLRKPPPDAQK